MSEESEMQQIGAFEPSDAKRAIALLEARQIPFEVEVDDSALANPNRWIQLCMGVYPEGSKVVLLVPGSRVPDATEALTNLFPA